MSGQQPPPLPPAPVVLPEPELSAPAPSPPVGAVPAGWEGIIQPGEAILWRGRPVARVNLLRLGLEIGSGVLFTGFFLFWMVMAAQGGGIFWMFGLIFFFTGLGMLAKTVLNERMRLRDTFFTLSNRAAYIARHHWLSGRQLETYRITAALRITLNGDASQGDVIFASRTVRSKNGSHEVPVGFLDIEDAPAVFALMTQARDALQ